MCVNIKSWDVQENYFYEKRKQKKERKFTVYPIPYCLDHKHDICTALQSIQKMCSYYSDSLLFRLGFTLNTYMFNVKPITEPIGDFPPF